MVDEVDDVWADRHSRSNRLPEVFDSEIIGNIDTFPVGIDRHKKGDIQSHFYQGKYKDHIIKIQLVSNNRGDIMWYSGPHFGPTHDLTIWNKKHIDLDNGDKLLADKAYCSVLHEDVFVTPFKKPHSRNLEEEEEAFNTAHAFYRATVEHVFAYLKRYKILSSSYRGLIKITQEDIGDIKNDDNDDNLSSFCSRLGNAVKIIIHTSNMYLKQNCLRQYDLENIIEPEDQLRQRVQNAILDRIQERKNQQQQGNQDNDMDMDIDLNEGPDPLDGTGNTIDDFKVGDPIQVWIRNSWWDAKVTYLSQRYQTVSLRILGEQNSRPDYEPTSIRHQPQQHRH